MDPSLLPSHIQLSILQHLGATANRIPPRKSGQVEEQETDIDPSSNVINLESLPLSGFIVKDSFFSSALTTQIDALLSQSDRSVLGLRPAKVGTGALKRRDEHVRGDEIAFVDAAFSDGSVGAGNVTLENVVKLVAKALQPVINQINNAFGLTGDAKLRSNNSMQVARYSDGTFYKKHRDSSPMMPGRLITVIAYFALEWVDGKGGELRLHLPNSHKDAPFIDVKPIFNRLLIFKSHYEHEVLPTFCDRFAFTMWLYSDNPHTIETICKEPPITVPKSITLKEDSSSTIFISIASYRDPDTHPTVLNILSTAKYPSRLTIAILYQDHSEYDKDLHSQYPLPTSSPATILTYTIPSTEATGPYAARLKIVQTLFPKTSCTHYLQLDSHMRFTQNWDTLLLSRLSQAPSENPIISFYPPPFTSETLAPEFSPPAGIHGPVMMRYTHMDNDGIPRISGRIEASPPSLKHAFIASGFLFARADVVPVLYGLKKTQPRDAGLDGLFFGEEVLCSVRAYTAGWDCFSVVEGVVWHRWGREYRKTFWENFGGVEGGKEDVAESGALEERRRRAQSVVRFVCLGEGAEAEFDGWRRGEAGGCSLVRSIEGFWAWTGIKAPSVEKGVGENVDEVKGSLDDLD